MKKKKRKIEIGDKVKCMVTGFKGIAYEKAEFFNGCSQFLVKPKVGKDNDMPKGEWLDEIQLQYDGKGLDRPIDKILKENPQAITGGRASTASTGRSK